MYVCIMCVCVCTVCVCVCVSVCLIIIIRITTLTLLIYTTMAAPVPAWLIGNQIMPDQREFGNWPQMLSVCVFVFDHNNVSTG